SAIMRNMTKPRYASMAMLRAAGGGLGTDGFGSGNGSRTVDSSTGGKSHLPGKFRLEIIILGRRPRRPGVKIEFMPTCDRRKFLHRGLTGLAAGALSQLGTHAESRNWIDAHVHVWTNDFQSYPLAEGYKPEVMKPRTFLPEDILRHARPHGVNRVVLIQMSYYRFDNSYMLDVIRKAPD